RVLEALLRRPAVPALPDARRAVLDLEQPAGIGAPEQEAIGDVLAPDRVQREEQLLRPDEAGREVPAARLDVGHQALRRLRQPRAVEQPEGDGERVRALRVAADLALVVD